MDIATKAAESSLEYRSVVREWVGYLPFKMQSVLLLGMRGCDGLVKEDWSKPMVRKIRRVILYNANPNFETDPNDRFMQNTADDETAAANFLSDLDAYPVHWLMHFAHASEIIGYHHPTAETSEYWLNVYLSIVEAIHLNPETYDQLQERLGIPDPRRLV